MTSKTVSDWKKNTFTSFVFDSARVCGSFFLSVNIVAQKGLTLFCYSFVGVWCGLMLTIHLNPFYIHQGVQGQLNYLLVKNLQKALYLKNCDSCKRVKYCQHIESTVEKFKISNHIWALAFNTVWELFGINIISYRLFGTGYFVIPVQHFGLPHCCI